MANNTSQIQLTALDFDAIKQNLITYLQSQSQFADYNFQGSAFNILLDILAYNTTYNAFYMNMLANEMFLDTAVLRSSVVSQAKSLGYTSKSSTAAQAIVNLTVTKGINDQTTILNVPRFTSFVSSALNGASYTFYTVEDSEYVANTGNTFTFNSLVIKEGVPTTKSFLYSSTANPSQYFDLVDQNIDLSTLQVVVQSSTTNPSYTVFTLAEDATTVTANSNVYFVEEGPNANYIIYFGDGILSANLVDQNIVTVSYLITNADNANDLQSFGLQTSILDGSVSSVTTATPSFGGSPIESIDSIKTNAPKSFIAQNRIVTKNDYITIINKKYPYFDSVTVWGGEEETPPVYGQVFISAKPKNGYVTTTSQVDYLINEIIRPFSVLTVTPNFVNPDYDYLNFNLNVNYDPSQTIQSQQNLISSIISTVYNYANTNLNTFNSSFQYSKFLTAIDGTDQSIQSSTSTVYIEKRFNPSLIESETYTIKFGTSLHHGISNDRLYSTGFIQLDSSGNEQECYIEETPFDFGSIESVTINSPGYAYTTAPTIIIEGDGLGANAYPVIVNGQINSVVVDVAGNNYTTAAITLSGGGGTGASLTPNLTGGTGVLRTYYFDTNNVKHILNPTAGTIDYINGIVTLNNFYPLSVIGTDGVLSIFAQPDNYSFSSKNQIILTLDQTSLTAVSVILNAVSS